jgi:hypothetical protein
MNRTPGQRDKFKPYVRLMNGKEKAQDFRTSLRLSLLGSLRHERPVYVMVQKGCPNFVMAVGLSKHDIKSSILPVLCRKKTFNEWAHGVKRYAQRLPSPPEKE